MTPRLSENAHLPFHRLTALSKVEGPRYLHLPSLRRTQKVKGRRLKENQKKHP